MNRIYQGKVTAVEIPDSKDEPGKPLDLDILWRHHELFQDAVNYYAFALAVMAEGMTEKDEDGKEKPTPMARFAEQVLGNNPLKILPPFAAAVTATSGIVRRN